MMEFIGSVVADGSIDRQGHRVRFNVKKERKIVRYTRILSEIASQVDGVQLPPVLGPGMAMRMWKSGASNFTHGVSPTC